MVIRFQIEERGSHKGDEGSMQWDPWRIGGGVPITKGWGDVGAETIKITVKVQKVEIPEDWVVLW